MASIKIELPAETWVDVTQGNEKGTITHYQGRSNIIFVQAAVIPSLTPPLDNPVADELDPDVHKVKYFSGLSAERVWACSLKYSSIVVLTESEI